MTIRPRRWRTREGWEAEREGESALLMARRFRSAWRRLDEERRLAEAVEPERRRTRNGWETEREGEAAALAARRSQGAWDRHERAFRRRRFLRRAWSRAKGLLLGAATAGGCLAWMLASSPWPATVTLRHYVAFFNCAAARTVGLTPARAGQPGYWDRLDADEDGVACEWWPPTGRGPAAPSPLRFR